MTRGFLVAILGSASILAAAHAQTRDARGLDYQSYLQLRRDMTEGQVISIAGQPDLVAEQGFSGQDTAGASDPEHKALAIRTYTYLPTAADPYTTTVTLVGGRVTDIRRDPKF